MNKKNLKIFNELIEKLKKEYNNLTIKINNLDIWIKLNEKRYDNEYIFMLEQQKDIMVEYSEILYQRIKYLIAKYN